MLFLCCTTSKWPSESVSQHAGNSWRSWKKKRVHSNQHLALAKILVFYAPSPPILLQLLSKKKYFRPAGLPCNKISQNLCVNLQTGLLPGIWALPAVIYSSMWHLFPAQWHWQGLQLWPGQCGRLPREPRAPALVEGSNGHCKGWRETSSLFLPPHHPAGNGAFSPSQLFVQFCLSFFCPFTTQGTAHPDQTHRVDTRNLGCIQVPAHFNCFDFIWHQVFN